MFAGLGMYCIGGIVLGLVLGVVIAIVVIAQQREQKKLEWDIEVRRRQLKAQGLLEQE